MMGLSSQVKEQEQNEEANDKTDQSNEKKVPVLTLSLRPGKKKKNHVLQPLQCLQVYGKLE